MVKLAHSIEMVYPYFTKAKNRVQYCNNQSRFITVRFMNGGLIDLCPEAILFIHPVRYGIKTITCHQFEIKAQTLPSILIGFVLSIATKFFPFLKFVTIKEITSNVFPSPMSSAKMPPFTLAGRFALL